MHRGIAGDVKFRESAMGPVGPLPRVKNDLGQLSPLGLCGGLSLEKTYERGGTALMTNDRRA